MRSNRYLAQADEFLRNCRMERDNRRVKKKPNRYLYLLVHSILLVINHFKFAYLANKTPTHSSPSTYSVSSPLAISPIHSLTLAQITESAATSSVHSPTTTATSESYQPNQNPSNLPPPNPNVKNAPENPTTIVPDPERIPKSRNENSKNSVVVIATTIFDIIRKKSNKPCE